MQLDVQSLTFMEIAAALLVALILPSARDAREVPGLRDAGIAAVCVAVAFTFQLLRGPIPAPIAATGFNVLLYAGLATQWNAYRLFNDPRADRRMPVVLAGACAAVFVALWIADVGYVVRTIVTSLFLAAFTAAGAWEVARPGLAGERSRSICIGLGTLVSACMLLRVGIILASDHVDTDATRPSLERTIAYFPALLYTLGVGLGFLVMHRERSDARSRELSLTDPLTGCFNRRALEERVRGEIDHAVRTSRPLSLVVVDIDHFKRVNDTHGHAAGDDVIRHVSALLKREARKSDMVARYGGEEFCMLLRESPGEGAAVLAERVRAALRAEAAAAAAGPITVSASFGIASFDPAAKEDWQALFKRADEALYRAKEAGRDRVVRG